MLKPKMLVRHKATGKLGVTMPTSRFLSEDGPISVHLEDDSQLGGTTLPCFGGEQAFEVLGPNPAVAEFEKCGGGQGAKCCKYMVVGPDGLECARFTSMHEPLIFREMVSQRRPVKLYPACQTEEEPAA